MKPRILLTGAATLVGAEIVKDLLLRSDIESILLVVPPDESGLHRDPQRLEAYLGPLPSSITYVAGDLRLPNFGLSPADFEELANSFDTGFHCAQREAKDQNITVARSANVQSVDTWIQLLDHNPELRLHHLSTAFIGGTRQGLLTEFDLNCGQGFNNAWERSMFEAETHLRESEVSDRVTVYRASHTLGCAATGESFNLGGAYPLLATLAASKLLPGDARARIDFIPADFVATAMVALADSGATGTFHLACGWGTSLTIREAADLAAKGRGRARGVRLLPRGIALPSRIAGTATLGGLSSRSLAFSTARALLHQGPVFDTYLADLALAPLGITRPVPESWLDAAVRGAEARSWEAPPPDEFDGPVA